MKSPFTTPSAFAIAIAIAFTPPITPAFAIAIAIALTSCSTTKNAPQIVEHSVHDTLYLSNVQYDSIYIYQETNKDYHRGNLKLIETGACTEHGRSEGMKLFETVDTIYIKDVATQYHYKYLRDTTYVHRVDTIPVIQEVEVVQQVKYTPWYAKALAWLGAISLTLIISIIILKLLKL